MDLTLIRYLRGGSPITPPGGSSSFSSPAITKRYHTGGSSSGSSSFGRTLSPLSAIENVKSPSVPAEMIEEDVLVMDGIPVASAPAVRVSRSKSSDSGALSSNSISAAASSPSSSSSGGNSAHKTELCVVWRDLGQCRYGSKCQFAHGKEEQPPAYFAAKKKNDAHKVKSYTTESSSRGLSNRYLHQMTTEAPETASQKTSPAILEHQFKSLAFTTSPECSSKNTTMTAFKDWSPLDDGIEVILPTQTGKCPSRNDVDAYVHDALYGARTKKRLPVLEEIYPNK